MEKENKLLMETSSDIELTMIKANERTFETVFSNLILDDLLGGGVPETLDEVNDNISCIIKNVPSDVWDKAQRYVTDNSADFFTSVKNDENIVDVLDWFKKITFVSETPTVTAGQELSTFKLTARIVLREGYSTNVENLIFQIALTGTAPII